MPNRLADPLRLDAATRAELWTLAGDAIEDYYREVGQLSAAGGDRLADVRAVLAQFDLERPLPPRDAVKLVVEALRRLQPQPAHPRYFGLFDPAPTAAGVLGDALAAAFNPCLASWDSSPFGVETERMLVAEFGQRFGYPPAAADGIITSGGSEANLTAVMLALTAHFPEHRELGLRGLRRQPVFYLTREAHPSSAKAALVTGLGSAAVREVAADAAGRMDAGDLERLIDADTGAGRAPFMVVATAGTTGGGVIDPISEVAAIAARRGLWLHVDAAWGGAIVLLPEMRGHLAGIDRADSITFDPHKWLSVPRNCGLLLTRHRDLLGRAFSVPAHFRTDSADPGGPAAAAAEPFSRSIPWSRGFAGLKLLLSLAVAGWAGYQEVLRRQLGLAEQLRDRLRGDGWVLVNDTVLPVVCFTWDAAGSAGLPGQVAAAVNATGQARMFAVSVGGQHVLRACVTNYATTAADIDLLADLLARARADVTAKPAGQLPAQAGGGCGGY